MISDLQWHIRCKQGTVAKYVILPGDPGRVKRIVAAMDEAHLVAENREYITYTGTARGVPLSVCSTGIGGPAASIALEELANTGGEVFIRVGSAAGRGETIPIGSSIVITAAHRDEGTSKAYLPIEFPAVADLAVTNALIDAAKARGVDGRAGIASTRDAFYSVDLTVAEKLRKAGVIAAEMESATLFVVGACRGVRIGCIVTTDSNRWLPVQPSADERLDLFMRGEKTMIEVALDAVALLSQRRI